jgi:hypothetical protein
MLKYSERNLPQNQFIYHKSHIDCPGIEPESPRWEAGTVAVPQWTSKGKDVKLSLCLIKHHAMKTYGGMEV